MKPREIAEAIDESAKTPEGEGDRFAGYAVLGVPFRSGHVLAMRRFPASSVGPGYTSVWHRNPAGRWKFYSTVAPEQSCSRYFGEQVCRNVVTRIELEWTCTARLRVRIARVLEWEMALSETAASRAANVAARLVPEKWWQERRMLQVLGTAARIGLGTGRMNLTGRTPNGQDFILNPQRIWVIDASTAEVEGVDAGRAGPLREQARLNEFLIPQRGVFAVVQAFMDARDGKMMASNEGVNDHHETGFVEAGSRGRAGIDSDGEAGF